MMDCASNGLSIAKQKIKPVARENHENKITPWICRSSSDHHLYADGCVYILRRQFKRRDGWITGSVISGWAVDTDNPTKSASVVLYVYTDGTTEAKELARVTADQYRSDLANSMGKRQSRLFLHCELGRP